MVQVGSQVSGIVESLQRGLQFARPQGQVLATLDQSHYQTRRRAGARPRWTRRAEAERLRVGPVRRRLARSRARGSVGDGAAAAADLESAEDRQPVRAAQVVGGDAKSCRRSPRCRPRASTSTRRSSLADRRRRHRAQRGRRPDRVARACRRRRSSSSRGSVGDAGQRQHRRVRPRQVREKQRSRSAWTRSVETVQRHGQPGPAESDDA
jgi:hypothetical protein